MIAAGLLQLQSDGFEHRGIFEWYSCEQLWL